jgi:hypothetical protein
MTENLEKLECNIPWQKHGCASTTPCILLPCAKQPQLAAYLSVHLILALYMQMIAFVYRFLSWRVIVDCRRYIGTVDLDTRGIGEMSLCGHRCFLNSRDPVRERMTCSGEN